MSRAGRLDFATLDATGPRRAEARWSQARSYAEGRRRRRWSSWPTTSSTACRSTRSSSRTASSDEYLVSVAHAAAAEARTAAGDGGPRAGVEPAAAVGDRSALHETPSSRPSSAGVTAGGASVGSVLFPTYAHQPPSAQTPLASPSVPLLLLSADKGYSLPSNGGSSSDGSVHGDPRQRRRFMVDYSVLAAAYVAPPAGPRPPPPMHDAGSLHRRLPSCSTSGAGRAGRLRARVLPRRHRRRRTRRLLQPRSTCSSRGPGAPHAGPPARPPSGRRVGPVGLPADVRLR